VPKLHEMRFRESPWRSLSESAARRIQAVSANLVARLEYVTDWRLQKSYYLAEVWSIEEKFERLSAADFASWSHGPWSLPVREAEEALEVQGVLVRTRGQARRRPEAEFLHIGASATVPRIPDDAEFLDEVTRQIKFLDGVTLTQVAKATLPYKEARPRQRIDLDGYLDLLRRKHARLQASAKVAALVEEARAE